MVPPADRGLLVAAAYLHDVGYAPELAKTYIAQRYQLLQLSYDKPIGYCAGGFSPCRSSAGRVSVSAWTARWSSGRSLSTVACKIAWSVSK